MVTKNNNKYYSPKSILIDDNANKKNLINNQKDSCQIVNTSFSINNSNVVKNKLLKSKKSDIISLSDYKSNIKSLNDYKSRITLSDCKSVISLSDYKSNIKSLNDYKSRITLSDCKSVISLSDYESNIKSLSDYKSRITLSDCKSVISLSDYESNIKSLNDYKSRITLSDCKSVISLSDYESNIKSLNDYDLKYNSTYIFGLNSSRLSLWDNAIKKQAISLEESFLEPNINKRNLNSFTTKKSRNIEKKSTNEFIYKNNLEYKILYNYKRNLHIQKIVRNKLNYFIKSLNYNISKSYNKQFLRRKNEKEIVGNKTRRKIKQDDSASSYNFSYLEYSKTPHIYFCIINYIFNELKKYIQEKIDTQSINHNKKKFSDETTDFYLNIKSLFTDEKKLRSKSFILLKEIGKSYNKNVEKCNKRFPEKIINYSICNSNSKEKKYTGYQI